MRQAFASETVVRLWIKLLSDPSLPTRKTVGNFLKRIWRQRQSDTEQANGGEVKAVDLKLK